MYFNNKNKPLIQELMNSLFRTKLHQTSQQQLSCISMITQHKQEYQIYFDKTFLLQSYGHENQLITPNFNLMAVQFSLMTIMLFFS